MDIFLSKGVGQHPNMKEIERLCMSSCTASHAKPRLRISQKSPDVFLHSCANGANGVVACGLRYLVKPHGSEYIGLRGQGFLEGGVP